MCDVHPGDAACGGMTRRAFLKGTLSCGAYVAAALAAATAVQQRAFAAAAREVVAETKFARVEKVAEGAWAVISTPQGGQFTTVSNGGIIAGKDAVLAIEGFMNPAGATWLREVAESVAGRAPTHVVMTHFHNDHIGGVGGYAGGGAMPKVVVTETVRGKLKPDQMSDVMVVSESGPTELDLGGRAVKLAPRRGHTPSDLSVELVDPKITWCGDLYWNGMFPNYVDAIPSELEANCRALLGDAGATYVPGHGGVAGEGDVARYIGLLEDIEATARKAYAAGTPAEEVFQTYTPPTPIGEWEILLPNMHKAAFVKWEEELKKG